MTATLGQKRVVIGSCVGGGPMERLARRLEARGVDATVVCTDSPESWRGRMRTPLGRVGARLRAFVGTPLALLGASFERDEQVIVPTTNPFFLPAVMVATRALHGRAVVPLIYDLYPDALEAGGVQTGPLARVAEQLNRFVFRHADGVVFIGEKMAEHARQRYGAPGRDIVLETGVDTAELQGAPLASDGTPLDAWLDAAPDAIVLSYVGNVGLVHDVDTLAVVLSQLERFQGRVRVVIAATGPGVDVLRRAAAESPHVRFEAPLPDAAWARLLRRSHLSIATLKPAAFRTSIPSKALSAMGAGSAVLAIAPLDSDLGALVTRHGAGAVFAPGDAEPILAWLGGLEAPALAALRAQALRAARTHYDLVALAERWERFLAQAGERRQADPLYDALKRAADVAVALPIATLAAPILLGSALAVRLSLGAPVVFEQRRPGRDGRTFVIRKFRTMRPARAHEQGPEHDGARLTRVGKALRATSLDELPTLLTVLMGHMSLVGPRPLLERYLPRYSARQARRHEVPPGITGWAQANGRNAQTWDQRFEHDLFYVENRSLWLDLRTLVRTVRTVLRRDGISQDGHATMPEFMGGASTHADPASERPAPSLRAEAAA